MNKRPLIATLFSSLFVGIASGAAMVSPETAEHVIKSLSDASQSQIAQAGFFFTLAAIIHSGRMKKEIRSNFEALAVSIDKVAAAFRDDLKSHGERLDNLAVRVASLESNNTKNKEK